MAADEFAVGRERWGRKSCSSPSPAGRDKLVAPSGGCWRLVWIRPGATARIDSAYPENRIFGGMMGEA